jgi:hypothetical protein
LEFFKLRNENPKQFDEKILEKQKKKLETYGKYLKKAFPCNTDNVIIFNALYFKDYNGLNSEELLKDYKYNFTNKYDANYLSTNSEIAKIIGVIQKRGEGKTHHAYHYAVALNKPTIYLDLSVQQNVEVFKDPLVNDVKKIFFLLNDNNAIDFFNLIYLTKILFFYLWLINQGKDIIYSDFLRISSPNNFEHNSYNFDLQTIILNWIVKNKFNVDNLITLTLSKINSITKEKLNFLIDEVFDMRRITTEEFNCFSHRLEADNVKNHNLYHPLLNSLFSLIGKNAIYLNPIHIYGTNLTYCGVLSGKYSSFKEGEILLKFIDELYDGKIIKSVINDHFNFGNEKFDFFLQLIENISPISARMAFNWILNDFIFNINESKSILQKNNDSFNVFDELNNENNFKKLISHIRDKCFSFFPDKKKDIDEFKVVSKLFLNCCLIYPIKNNLSFPIFSFLPSKDNSLELVDKGLLSLKKIIPGNNITVYTEPILYLALKEYFKIFIKPNSELPFITPLNFLVEDYISSANKNDTGKGFKYEDLECFLIFSILNYYKENNIPLSQFYLFKNLKIDGINIDDYEIQLEYASNNINLDSNSIKNSFLYILCPLDKNNGGPDKIFTLVNKNDKNKKILILIQDKDETSFIGAQDAVKSVWTSPLYTIYVENNNIENFQIWGEKKKKGELKKNVKDMKEINSKKQNINEKIEEIDFNNIYQAKWIKCRNNNNDDFVNELKKFSAIISIVISNNIKPSKDCRVVMIPEIDFKIKNNLNTITSNTNNNSTKNTTTTNSNIQKRKLIFIQKKNFFDDLIKKVPIKELEVNLNRITNCETNIKKDYILKKKNNNNGGCKCGKKCICKTKKCLCKSNGKNCGHFCCCSIKCKNK